VDPFRSRWTAAYDTAQRSSDRTPVREASDRARSAVPVRARLGWDDFNDIIWPGVSNNYIQLMMLKS